MSCRFFSPGSRDCRESQAAAGGGIPADKEMANFCDWFSLDPKYRSAAAGQRKDRDKAEAARSAFDNLFN
jgi:hypothetical protein